jgi:hypothetical protein
MVRVQYLFLGVFQSPETARCEVFQSLATARCGGFFCVEKVGLRNGEGNIETLFFAINLIN